MKYASRLLVSLAAIAGFASTASAATVGGPSPGLWYDPDESGRGYDIDVQGDTMIVSTYVYDAQHNPIWYLSAGPYDHDTSTFTSTYDSFSGGQCFGCPYTAPTPHVGAGGPITITFTTNQTATITYPGGSSNIVKYAFGFPTRTDVLAGEWAFTYETGGNVTGDWVVFDQTFTDPTSGAVFVKGHAAGDTTVTALGIYDPVFREAQVEVTDGTTKRLYRYGIFDDRRVIGSATITTGTDSVGPFPSTGARLLYKSEVLGGLVIGSTADAAKTAESASSDDQAIRDRFSRARAALEAEQR